MTEKIDPRGQAAKLLECESGAPTSPSKNDRFLFIDPGGVGGDHVARRIHNSNPKLSSLRLDSPISQNDVAMINRARFVHGNISWHDVETYFKGWRKFTALQDPIARRTVDSADTTTAYVHQFSNKTQESTTDALVTAKINIRLLDYVLITDKIVTDLPRLCAIFGLNLVPEEPKPIEKRIRIDSELICDHMNDVCAKSRDLDIEDRELYYTVLDECVGAPFVRTGVRPLIAFVSPVFPQEYGVPVYSLMTAKALYKHARIDLFNTVAPPSEYASLFHAHIEAPTNTNLGTYDNRLFVIGNNYGLHKMAIALARNAADGVCIHHDPQLLDQTTFTLGHEKTRLLAERVLGRAVSHAELGQWFADRTKLPHPLLTPLGKGRFIDVVHSPVQREVQKAFYPNAEIAFLPHAIQHLIKPEQITEIGRAAARTSLGIPIGQKMIVSCGAINSAKRAADAIFALCHIHDWGQQAHLYFVGVVENDDNAVLINIAKGLGLENYVHFSGRVTEDTYMQYLAAADVGVQLRLTLFGQLSGALIDCIAAALPTVAPSSLASALEAPAFVTAIPNTYTSLDVAVALERAMESGRTNVDLEEWRAFVDDHSFERYGQRLAYLLAA